MEKVHTVGIESARGRHLLAGRFPIVWFYIAAGVRGGPEINSERKCSQCPWQSQARPGILCVCVRVRRRVYAFVHMCVYMRVSVYGLTCIFAPLSSPPHSLLYRPQPH